MKLAFIGPRGAGKSKLSRKFSKQTGKLLLSTDMLVCYEAGGRTVQKIVEEEGWISFRDREYQLLKKLHSMDDIIIDCGGGILFDIDPETGKEIESKRKISLLKEDTILIYVLRNIDWLLEKNTINTNRPHLSSHTDYSFILKRRLPIYEKHADYILDMRNRTIEEGLKELKKQLYQIF